MNLSRIEQETIIVFNEVESEATVYTNNRKVLRRLEQLERDRPDDVSRDHKGDFIIPKGWIKITPSRILTEEQRAEMAARGAGIVFELKNIDKTRCLSPLNLFRG